MVTESEATRVLEEPKVIGANLSWQHHGETHRLEATVLCTESQEVLKLRGFVGRTNRSFVLLHRNTPIRKYTVHAFHRDPVTGIRTTGPHKHFWDDEWEDKRVYVPRDIRIGNPHVELLDFLRECNIELQRAYTPQSFA